MGCSRYHCYYRCNVQLLYPLCFSIDIVFAEIALLLMCKMNMNREYTLLTILNMFETEIFTSTPTSNVNQKSNSLPSSLLIDPEKDVILTQQADITREARLPLFSLSRGKSAMKLHSLFHILMQFHLPSLCEHLDGVYDSWWKPYSYPIEKQDDYVTVKINDLIHL